MENKKRALVTGGAGSIGIHVVAHLMTNTHWDVVIIDSFRHKGWCDRIVALLTTDEPEHRGGHPDWAKRISVITHDLTAPFSDLTKKRIGHIDYIIHLASLSDVEASIHDPVNFIQNNLMLTVYLLEYAREAKPESFILFSTDEVYGPTESKEAAYPEWSPIVPSNPYAASKAMQEAAGIAYWRTYNVPVVITNTMNNFGEMQQSSKYPVMIQKAVANDQEVTIHAGEAGIGSRSYIHSRNTADAVLFILKNCPPHMHVPETADKPDKYNIAGDKQMDNLELAQAIASVMGKELKHKVVDFHHTRPGHDPHYGLTNDKLANLGWKAPVSFEESLKNTIDWQTAHSEWINT